MPLKVAHVTTVDFSLYYLLLNQMVSIQEAGYEVTSISSAGSCIPAVQSAGIHHIPVSITRNLTPIADLVSLWRLCQVMRRERFTIVHTHNSKAGVLGRVAASLSGVPIVIHTYHGLPFEENGRSFREILFTFVERIAAGVADRLLFQSVADANLALKRNITTRDKTIHLGNGIDLSRFAFGIVPAKGIRKTREKLGITSQKVVLMAAELIPRKAPKIFVQAAARVIRTMPNVQFVLVGEGPLRRNIEKTIGELHLDERVLVPGFWTEMPALYSLCSLCVLCSLREGIPRSIIEAMAMERPVIATDIRGMRELIIDGSTGYVVPVLNPEALADKILEILTDDLLALQMGEAGRRHVLEHFDEKLVTERTIQTYDLLLKEKGLIKDA